MNKLALSILALSAASAYTRSATNVVPCEDYTNFLEPQGVTAIGQVKGNDVVEVSATTVSRKITFKSMNNSTMLSKANTMRSIDLSLAAQLLDKNGLLVPDGGNLVGVSSIKIQPSRFSNERKAFTVPSNCESIAIPNKLFDTCFNIPVASCKFSINEGIVLTEEDGFIFDFTGSDNIIANGEMLDFSVNLVGEVSEFSSTCTNLLYDNSQFVGINSINLNSTDSTDLSGSKTVTEVQTEITDLIKAATIDNPDCTANTIKLSFMAFTSNNPVTPVNYKLSSTVSSDLFKTNETGKSCHVGKTPAISDFASHQSSIAFNILDSAGEQLPVTTVIRYRYAMTCDKKDPDFSLASCTTKIGNPANFYIGGDQKEMILDTNTFTKPLEYVTLGEAIETIEHSLGYLDLKEDHPDCIGDMLSLSLMIFPAGLADESSKIMFEFASTPAPAVPYFASPTDSACPLLIKKSISGFMAKKGDFQLAVKNAVSPNESLSLATLVHYRLYAECAVPKPSTFDNGTCFETIDADENFQVEGAVELANHKDVNKDAPITLSTAEKQIEEILKGIKMPDTCTTDSVSVYLMVVAEDEAAVTSLRYIILDGSETPLVEYTEDGTPCPFAAAQVINSFKEVQSKLDVIITTPDSASRSLEINTKVLVRLYAICGPAATGDKTSNSFSIFASLSLVSLTLLFASLF